jgi:hypothetical protein
LHFLQCLNKEDCKQNSQFQLIEKKFAHKLDKIYVKLNLRADLHKFESISSQNVNLSENSITASGFSVDRDARLPPLAYEKEIN